jgi:hypothetical protein
VGRRVRERRSAPAYLRVCLDHVWIIVGPQLSLVYTMFGPQFGHV